MADLHVDLGPEGGIRRVISWVQGNSREQLAKIKKAYTGNFSRLS